MTTTASTRKLRIGMIGGGTVGGGVYQLIQRSPLLSRCCDVAKICVRDVTKPRDFMIVPTSTTSTTTTVLTSNVDDILQDPSIDVIVEVVGGSDGIAKHAVFAALQSNKSVVTANKALIAQHMTELEELFLLLLLPNNNTTTTTTTTTTADDDTASATAVPKPLFFLFEAAVCGGIPIIHTLQTCYVGDVIYEVMGICNGTTNYMLSAMQSESKDYHQALQEAQALGYAEADPTADVEGFDVQAKIAILAKLAFGKTMEISVNGNLDASIPRRGISQIQPIDFDYAKVIGGGGGGGGGQGAAVKLLGYAKSSNQQQTSSDNNEDDDNEESKTATSNKNKKNKKILQVYVAPHVVPSTHDFASVGSNGNAVRITSANLGSTTYKGPGAGRFPTANSVVADLYRLATNKAIAPPFSSYGIASSNHEKDDDIILETDYTSIFYLRWPSALVNDATVLDLAKELDISVDRLLELPAAASSSSSSSWHALVTQPTKLSKLEAWNQTILTTIATSRDASDEQQQQYDKPFFMPVLSE